MIFASPWMLPLTLVPAAALAFALWRGREMEDGRWPNIRRGEAIFGRIRFDRREWNASRFPWRFWLAFLFAVLALARPQWGQSPMAADPARGELLIALDLSRSMLAADASPSRLEQARGLAQRVSQDMAGRKVGLIGFAGAAYLLAGANEDQAVLRAFLAKIAPHHIATQGTDFAALLDTAMAGFGAADEPHCLLLLSDGEAESSDWRTRLPELMRRGIRVIALGMGTEDGAEILVDGGRPLRDGVGTPVHSRLQPADLKALAAATGGSYLAEPTQEQAVQAVTSAMDARVSGTQGESDGFQRADRFLWFITAALVLLLWSAAREWPARPRLRGVRTPLTVLAAGVALTTPYLIRPDGLHAQDAPSGMIKAMLDPDLHGQEPDPLLTVRQVVARLIAKPALDAGDYLALAEAATRYGEVHRGHAHPISEGVLRDGLQAVSAGRALDPKRADWAALQAKLNRLLQPPPPPPDDGTGPPDPANEPIEANRNQPVPGDRPPPGDQSGQQEEGQQGDGDEQDSRSVGGGRRDVYDPKEWNDPSLVQPLSTLEKLRRADSPAELFRLMQPPLPRSARSRSQTW